MILRSFYRFFIEISVYKPNIHSNTSAEKFELEKSAEKHKRKLRHQDFVVLGQTICIPFKQICSAFSNAKNLGSFSSSYKLQVILQGENNMHVD